MLKNITKFTNYMGLSPGNSTIHIDDVISDSDNVGNNDGSGSTSNVDPIMNV